MACSEEMNGSQIWTMKWALDLFGAIQDMENLHPPAPLGPVNRSRVGWGGEPVSASYTATPSPELKSSQKQALATDKPQSAIKENEGCYPLWGVKGCVGGTATISEAQAPSR